MQLAWKVEEGSKVKLKDYDPDYIDEHTDPAIARAELELLGAELGGLQELLAAAQHHSLLVVLQGMDASGKADTIFQVLSQVNPQGCEVLAFKGPTLRELAHDFLWRVHRGAPGRGVIGIFNRSHYEDVLVVRVHNLVPEKAWSQYYAAINDFEELLAQNDTIIVAHGSAVGLAFHEMNPGYRRQPLQVIHAETQGTIHHAVDRETMLLRIDDGEVGGVQLDEVERGRCDDPRIILNRSEVGDVIDVPSDPSVLVDVDVSIVGL